MFPSCWLDVPSGYVYYFLKVNERAKSYSTYLQGGGRKEKIADVLREG